MINFFIGNSTLYFNLLPIAPSSLLTSLDVEILRIINGYGGKFLLLDGFMLSLGLLGEMYFWSLLSIPLLLNKKHRETGIKWLILTAVTGLITLGLKALVARPRPYLVYEWVRVFGVQWGYSSYSFPSGHAMRCWSTALMFGLSIKCKGVKTRFTVSVVLIATAFLISLGRVYLGLHYPSDVIAGSLMGIAIGFFSKSTRKQKET
ncbi:MAG TPA: phosphatase PAP2 family protein [Thermoplasmata archaeon]|nr:phosphatase PAP2 family protein [Thermoplasmata archaeon]